jgi:hypothetical protein
MYTKGAPVERRPVPIPDIDPRIETEASAFVEPSQSSQLDYGGQNALSPQCGAPDTGPVYCAWMRGSVRMR